MDGDITILDSKAETTVDSSKFLSKSRNTPFNGWKLRGVPKTAIVAGNTAWCSGDVKLSGRK
jgi:dihydroorotase